MSEEAFEIAAKKIINETWSYGAVPKEISTYQGSWEKLFEKVLEAHATKEKRELLGELLSESKEVIAKGIRLEYLSTKVIIEIFKEHGIEVEDTF